MPIYAAVDSNALTYLVNAIGVEGYDPAEDKTGLADERVAMARLFMYGDCRLWVPPIVRIETEDIPADELRDTQNRMTWYQLLDHDSGVDESVIAQGVNELLQHHKGFNNCRMLAEAEAMEVRCVLTRDDELQRRLQDHARIRILRPAELWESLNIRCAPAHSMVPAAERAPARTLGKLRVQARTAAIDWRERNCKTSTPGSNPGGASNFNSARWGPFRFPIPLRTRGRSTASDFLRSHDFPPALAWGHRRFVKGRAPFVR